MRACVKERERENEKETRTFMRKILIFLF
jgi:hypothetical protein